MLQGPFLPIISNVHMKAAMVIAEHNIEAGIKTIP